jgi:hypothetical protein
MCRYQNFEKRGKQMIAEKVQNCIEVFFHIADHPIYVTVFIIVLSIIVAYFWFFKVFQIIKQLKTEVKTQSEIIREMGEKLEIIEYESLYKYK